MGCKWIALCILLSLPLAAAAQNDTAPSAAAPSLPDLVKRCGPAVVLIQAQLPAGSSQGSGVIVSPAGTVLTCYHVVREAKSVVAKTWNGGYFPAEGMLGLNPKADFAVLKLQAKELPSVPIGDYRQLQPGESVFAIASPDGLQNTVSEGVYSGLRKVGDLPESHRAELRTQGFLDTQELLQFTAPSYFGSSGGPLFSSRGEVVGLVAWRTGADAVYFAVPAKLAEPHLAGETVMKFGAGRPGVTDPVGAADPKYGSLPASVGLLPPQAASEEYIVPKTGEAAVRLRRAAFADTETVKVRYSGTSTWLTKTAGAPVRGQFRPLRGGGVLFSAADAGLRVMVDYDYTVQRAAVLPVVNLSGYPELIPLLREGLGSGLTARGYDLIPSIEVESAVREAGINVSSTAFGEVSSLEAGSIRQAAAGANAALVLYVMVQTSGNMDIQDLDLFVAVFDGHTGKDLFTRALSDRQSVSFGGRKSKRESGARSLLARLLEEYFGPAPEAKQ